MDQPRDLTSASTAFRRQMREQVLDIAEAQLIEHGWERVRIAGIATAAHVSRPTIYDEFGDKDGIGLALIMRETDRFLTGVGARLDRNFSQPALAIQSAVSYALGEAKRSPLLKAILTTTSHGSDSLLPLFTTRSRPLLERATDVIAGWWQEAFPSAYRAETRDSIETVVRLVVSHVVLPARPARAIPAKITAVATALLASELELIGAEDLS